ncbi:hypothetical protein [Tautonia marina]|uniref:hypothetical protein n=1 Tax=Tautonia marina TaxID=2653855 RepID=UPI0012612A4F|nr:hypothetical protein [Tautonia marina]
MQELDFSDSQLPPEELAEYRRHYRSEEQDEQARIDAKLARVKLCMGMEEHFRPGLSLKAMPLPLLVLRE